MPARPPPKRELLVQFAKVATIAFALALILRLVCGGRWFSFYGIAVTTIATLPLLTTVLLRAHRRFGWKRWPVWLLACITAAAALVQAGFWIVFFHGGGMGLGLGIGRAVAMPVIRAGVPWLAAAIAIAWAVLILRSVARPQKTTR
ncbi:MAG: hypothetical protein KDJ37_04800 [Hyphomicrobiaceae bacterium]|nr:hypothetical protein [Hyphomicrobiaceae bacterium]